MRKYSCSPILGVKLGGQARRADEIAEQDRDWAALGGRRRRRRRRARRLSGGFPGPQSGDRLEETLAVPQRHAKLIEVALCQIGQDLGIDFALAKRGLILTEAEAAAAQPSRDVHCCIRPAEINDGLVERACPGIGLNNPCGSNLALSPGRPGMAASRVARAFLVYVLPPLPRCSGWASFVAHLTQP
jgi:hypothetical protein